MYRPKPRIIGPGFKNENELSLKNLDKKAIFLNNNPRMRLAALSRLICPAPAVATRLKARESFAAFCPKGSPDPSDKDHRRWGADVWCDYQEEPVY